MQSRESTHSALSTVAVKVDPGASPLSSAVTPDDPASPCAQWAYCTWWSTGKQTQNTVLIVLFFCYGALSRMHHPLW